MNSSKLSRHQNESVLPVQFIIYDFSKLDMRLAFANEATFWLYI